MFYLRGNGMGRPSFKRRETPGQLLMSSNVRLSEMPPAIVLMALQPRSAYEDMGVIHAGTEC